MPSAVQSVETLGINSFRCRVCRGVHALRKCRRFLGLPAEKRLRAVLINKYCANCLAHQHSGQSCRSKAKCKTCGQSHHTLLHLPGARRRQRRRPAAARISGPTSSALAGTPAPQKGSRKGRRHQAASTTTREVTPPLSTLMQHKAVSILPTAIVIVQTDQKNFDVRALIDPCSPTTRIHASLARAMGLSATSVGPGEVCTATICSKTSDFHINAILQLDPQLNCRTPIRSIEHAANPAGITLADGNWARPSTVSVVLGADVYSHVILPGIVPSTDGRPMA
ncbi:uncharacterized protein LOC122757386 [Drosophila mojavensis]|uniref:uncharacterized protein LOC122757386 n=1 Tax=Drosophila mojavensis TaxID=7230 RepID=UPI001CD0BA35|nr:uncharacterized protein LOC122757386 [Drosophila mojavensis]